MDRDLNPIREYHRSLILLIHFAIPSHEFPRRENGGVSVAIVNRDDAGNIAPVAAMSTLIVLTRIGVRVMYWLVTKGLQQRTQAWLAK